ncbi:30S ribosomal protein S16 [Candidatus Saccharibacteria bacterium]|nr:30S ribosomal protein S16 [Candidatus Saccharibacteria bacterium]
MLAIRLQRLGRKAYPVYRVAVQESHRHPSSGRVVAYVGNYNPHTKETSLNKELIEKFLSNGAQPTDRVAKLLKDNGVKLPKWVKEPTKKEGAVKHPEKLRKNRPAEPEKPVAEAPKEETTVAEEPVNDTPAEEEKPTEEPAKTAE